MRLLDAVGCGYVLHPYDPEKAVSGTEVARELGQDPDRVFKTLVTQGRSGAFYVFMVPVACELDLKRAAAAAGEKSISMVKSRELLGLTGYVHGGCSPVGMKKLFPTFADETILLFDTVMCSGGRIGLQIELAPDDLMGVVGIQVADLTVR
mgnify:FL=1